MVRNARRSSTDRPTHQPGLVAAVTLTLLTYSSPVFGQPPTGGPPPAAKKAQAPPDEFKALVREVEEAYKAPLEVDKDIRDELRKQYQRPTPEREVKIFKEIRRLYPTTPDQEQAIVRELRRAYEQPGPEQEERVFREIRRGGQLPPGTVPVSIQAEQAEKLFRRFDQNGDGVLGASELPDALRGQVARWDRNRDGSIDFEEYGAYYQAHLQSVSARVASGEIPIKLPRGATVPGLAPKAEQKPPAARAGQPPALPAWFTEYDLDGDGQVGLYEWRQMKRATADFVAMDRNGDFLLEPKEVLLYLAEQAKGQVAGVPKAP